MRSRRQESSPSEASQRYGRSVANRWLSPESRQPVLRFLATFVALLAVFYAVMSIPWFIDHVFLKNLEFNAMASSWILQRLGVDATCTGLTVMSPRFAMQIRRGCEAMEPLAVYIAAVLAFPASWRSKAIGIGVGLIALPALNFLRIVTLYFAGVHWPSAFETLHVEVWQTLFVIFGLVLWLGWAWQALDRDEPVQEQR